MVRAAPRILATIVSGPLLLGGAGRVGWVNRSR